MATFTEARLAPLNGEIGLRDNGMRQALIEALEADEVPRALYSVSAHIWCDAVLTDRALLLVKGAMWAKVTRVPFPLEVIREPKGSTQSARVMTPLGRKTLWGSRLDPDLGVILGHVAARTPQSSPPPVHVSDEDGPVDWLSALLDSGSLTATEVNARPQKTPRNATSGEGPTGPTTGVHGQGSLSPRPRRTWRDRAEARRRAGKKPRKPKLAKVRLEQVGSAPPTTIWDMASHCVKCGRRLTNPESQRHRVGTDCIKYYGSHARTISNPAFEKWTERKSRAAWLHAEQQRAFTVQHEASLEAYTKELEKWRLIRAGR